MICQWWGDFWISWGDFIFHVVPCSGLTSCQKRCERSSTRTFLPSYLLTLSCSFLLFLPPFSPPTQAPNPPPLAQTLGVCLFLPSALLLQFSRCCGFDAACPSACQGLGFLCAFFPPSVSFLREAEEPPGKPRSRGAAGQAEKPPEPPGKPRSQEATREAEKPPDTPRSHRTS